MTPLYRDHGVDVIAQKHCARGPYGMTGQGTQTVAAQNELTNGIKDGMVSGRMQETQNTTSSPFSRARRRSSCACSPFFNPERTADPLQNPLNNPSSLKSSAWAIAYSVSIRAATLRFRFARGALSQFLPCPLVGSEIDRVFPVIR